VAATYEQTIKHDMDLYAVFVYRMTGDELVKEATLVAVKAMDWRQRAVAVKFVRGVADELREQLTEEARPKGMPHRLEQLASEIGFRDRLRWSS